MQERTWLITKYTFFMSKFGPKLTFHTHVLFKSWNTFLALNTYHLIPFPKNTTIIYFIKNSRILRLDEDLQVQQVYPLPDSAELSCVLAVGENQLLVSGVIDRLWQLDSTMGRWTQLKQAEWFIDVSTMAFCHERNVLYWEGREVVKRYAVS